MDILILSENNFESAFKKTISDLKKGKVVICPTDTVYGLIADASNEKAVKKIF